jgi:hypothetical protein
VAEKNSTKIVGVHRMRENAVIIEYSNNMSAVYTRDQLATIKPAQVATDEEVRASGRNFPDPAK